jgi:hypothetical protein
MKFAPSLFSEIKQNGKTYRRVPTPQTNIGCRSWEFVANNVDPDSPHVPHVEPGGDAAFETKREVEEFCAKTQSDPDHASYFFDVR